MNDINEHEQLEPDLMKIFDELTFRQKWAKVREGLKQPKDTGDYKWAKLQMFRLWSPISAVIVPVLMLLLITILAQLTPKHIDSITVTYVEPTPIEELDPVPPVEPITQEIETEIITDIITEYPVPSLPTDIISPPAEVASVQPAPVNAVAITVSPMVMRTMFGNRSPGAQGAAVGRFGGSQKTQDAVLRALRWLAKNQRTDGTWGKDKPAMTALALLAYLAHGDTPASDEFGYVVESALRFLVESQEPNGRFKGRDKHDYTHPIVAYALSEAYGMTKNPMVKESAIKALKIIVNGQNASGGFNYGLIPSGRNDTSYMAWCVQALKAGEIAKLNIEINGYDRCMTNSIRGFKINYGEKDGYGGFGYTSKSSDHGLSGAGVLCLQFLGQGRSREVKNSLPMIQRKWVFNWETPPKGSVLYYWYYITQACFQEGGATWDSWNRQFSPSLVKAQIIVDKTRSGYVDHKGNAQEIGSWISPADKEYNGGNGEMMDTTLSALMLMTYYRYLSTSQPMIDQEIENELGNSGDIVIKFE